MHRAAHQQRKLRSYHHQQHIRRDTYLGEGPVILPPSDDSKKTTNEDAQNNNLNNIGSEDLSPFEPGVPIEPKKEQNEEEHDHSNMNHDDMNHDDMNHNNMNHDNMNNHHMDHSSHNNMNMGTVMYMDGFHSALFPPSNSSPPPCLNLFHPTWTLHTQSRFIFAMIFITGLGMLVEVCGVWRVKCLRKGKNIRREMKEKRMQAWQEHQQHVQSQNSLQGSQLEFRRQQMGGVSDISDVSSHGNNNIMEPPSNNTAANTHTAATNTIICPAIIRRVWRIVPKCLRESSIFTTTNPKTIARRFDLAAATLHLSRAWLGYLLMLAVMSYAVEFLISACIGMVLGRYWFVDSGDGTFSGGGGMYTGAIGVGGGIGGMGLGEGGRQNSGQGGVYMMDFQANNNDATWGGGDPCCGIEDDEDENNHNDMREPLLLGNNVGRVTRRSGGLQTDDIP